MDKQGEYKMNLHITMNGISFHKYMGDKVNQQIENKKLTCKNGKCAVLDLNDNIDESYNERPEWAWLVEDD